MSFCCRRFPANTAVPPMDTETFCLHSFNKKLSASWVQLHRLFKNKPKGNSPKWDTHHLPGYFKLSHAHTFFPGCFLLLSSHRTQDLLPVESVSLCFLPYQVEGRQRKPQTTAESFISSIKLGYNNQSLSGQRPISQGTRKSFTYGLVMHIRARWGIFQLGGMPDIPGFWDFWTHLNIRLHKALSSLCSCQHLQEASGLSPYSPDASWAMSLPGF